MPRKSLPRIEAVSIGEKPWTLHVRWDRGEASDIDLSAVITKYRVYAPLRQSHNLFQQVRVGEYGVDVVWSDDIDMSADLLWRLAQEQSGATMGAQELRGWREREGYTLDTAAKALGISRRMLAYYEAGGRPIPRVVALATKALQREPPLADISMQPITPRESELAARLDPDGRPMKPVESAQVHRVPRVKS